MRNPPQIKYSGHTKISKTLLPRAKKELEVMHQTNKQSLEQVKRTVRFHDGTTITCMRTFNQDFIHIYVPPPISIPVIYGDITQETGLIVLSYEVSKDPYTTRQFLFNPFNFHFKEIEGSKKFNFSDYVFNGDDEDYYRNFIASSYNRNMELILIAHWFVDYWIPDPEVPAFDQYKRFGKLFGYTQRRELVFDWDSYKMDFTVGGEAGVEQLLSLTTSSGTQIIRATMVRDGTAGDVTAFERITYLATKGSLTNIGTENLFGQDYCDILFNGEECGIDYSPFLLDVLTGELVAKYLTTAITTTLGQHCVGQSKMIAFPGENQFCPGGDNTYDWNSDSSTTYRQYFPYPGALQYFTGIAGIHITRNNDASRGDYNSTSSFICGTGTRNLYDIATTEYSVYATCWNNGSGVVCDCFSCAADLDSISAESVGPEHVRAHAQKVECGCSGDGASKDTYDTLLYANNDELVSVSNGSSGWTDPVYTVNLGNAGCICDWNGTAVELENTIRIPTSQSVCSVKQFPWHEKEIDPYAAGLSPIFKTVIFQKYHDNTGFSVTLFDHQENDNGEIEQVGESTDITAEFLSAFQDKFSEEFDVVLFKYAIVYKGV